MPEDTIELIKLTAEFPPYYLEDVREALDAADLCGGGMVSDVKGFSGVSFSEKYRNVEYVIDFKPENKLEMVIPADAFERAAKAIEGVVPEEGLNLYRQPIEAAIDICSSERVTSGEPVEKDTSTSVKNVLGYGL